MIICTRFIVDKKLTLIFDIPSEESLTNPHLVKKFSSYLLHRKISRWHENVSQQVACLIHSWKPSWKLIFIFFIPFIDGCLRYKTQMSRFFSSICLSTDGFNYICVRCLYKWWKNFLRLIFKEVFGNIRQDCLGERSR